MICYGPHMLPCYVILLYAKNDLCRCVLCAKLPENYYFEFHDCTALH